MKNLLSLPCLMDDQSNTLRPKTLEMETAAKECFYDWNNSIIRAVNSVSNDMEVESRKMKLNGNAGRLALVLQLLKWASGEGHMDYVELESVRGAIALIDYYEETYARIKALVQDKPQDGFSWIHRLSTEFTSKDAEQAAIQAGYSRRTAYYALDKLSSGPNPSLVKTGHGRYAKTNDGTHCTFASSETPDAILTSQYPDNEIVANKQNTVQEIVQNAEVQSATRQNNLSHEGL